MAATTILAVSGSLRRESVNRALLRLAAEHAPEGVELVLWDGLAGLPAFNEDDEAAPAASVAELRRAIGDADALLIATPEYNGSVPGALKNALDWASRPHGGSVLVAKAAAVIGASPSPFGAIWAQEQLQKVLRLSGALVLERGLAVGKAAEKLADEGGRATLGAQLGEILAELTALEVEDEDEVAA
jgi:chromate reductase